MTASDYAPLIDKVRVRLLTWTSKHLSYAGRLQLLKSVISSMVNFWLSVFHLPKACLKEIDSICNAFLWSGSPNHAHKTKVAWDDVCIPKTEGGLGLRQLVDSSRVYAYSLIWRLLSSSSSLWVKWVKRHLIREHSFWTTPSTSLGSWLWKKLLKYRSKIKVFFRVTIGDGRKASFWHDSWLPQGPLINIMGENGPRTLGIPDSATVAQATDDENWRFRRRARHHREILDEICRLPIPHQRNGTDIYHWRHEHDCFKTTYSAAKTWEQIRTRKNKVLWSKLIWFAQGIPRSSFISWLAMKDRLSTGDRMRIWGHTQACVLCGERNETRDHLFFACPYTFTVWSMIAGPLLGHAINPDWKDTINSMLHVKFGGTRFILIRLAFQVSIDRIWRERNDRIHNSVWHNVEWLAHNIDRTVRNRLHSLSYASTPRLKNIMQHWLENRT